MTPVELLSIVSNGLAVCLFFFAVAMPLTWRARTLLARSETGELQIRGWVNDLFSPWIPSPMRRRLESDLRRADLTYLINPPLLALASLLFGFIVCLTFLATSVLLAPDALRLDLSWVLATGTLVAVTLPWLWVRRLARRRERFLIRDLPLTLDLIAMSLRSGASLVVAIERSASHLPAGPLRDEMIRVLRESRAGRSRERALSAWRDRSTQSVVRDAVSAMISSERHGADLSGLLTDQAAQRREERLTYAEEQAMKAPVKLLFPLLVFIFPGTLLILLYPVVFRLIATGLI